MLNSEYIDLFFRSADGDYSFCLLLTVFNFCGRGRGWSLLHILSWSVDMTGTSFKTLKIDIIYLRNLKEMVDDLIQIYNLNICVY